MASEQTHGSDDREVHSPAELAGTQFESLADKVRDVEISGDEKSLRGRESEMPSLEEISEYRAKAQQRSIEAIRAAEERYGATKKKESLARAAEKVKEYARQKAGEATEVVATKAEAATHHVGDKAAVAKVAAVETAKSAAGYAGNM
ncbi:seed biotin-containing protein SBP65-like isoform X3 [Malania oleifera]|uniref:seed biotin-containing protein SBP65-like isoform X3 n=1 Tax=Malania oleifera TaxID=397392 RepID=UPI0025ADB0B5|nr:seed biotin-containing protein SBP65-like isoform X3 [Malania oleifera]